ncbi:MAG: ABC-type uncharacterized transport system involved in gliding motility auxiliary subunit [Chlamydiales bacterium]|jgi:ABC-type uncharacterized transport system involved in gliding motility auxiliary subunit
MANSSAGQTRTSERFNGLLTACLLLGIVVSGNMFARAHLGQRRDFSEDQIYALSDASRSILGRLEGRLQVKAYFSGEILSGEVAIAKARLEGLLTECQVLSGGLMQVDTVDPGRSSDVLLEATNYGIEGRSVVSFKGTNRVEQQVFLGLALRYRGREAVLPFVDPWGFESAFISRVHDLLSERRAVVGWYESDPAAPVVPGAEASDPTVGLGTFGSALGVLARHHDVRPIRNLRDGEPVDTDVDVLFVVRPFDLHPRAVFEIDQYVQRGGRLVVMVDQVAMNSRLWTGESRGTGMDALLRCYGAPVAAQHIWDEPWKWPLEIPGARRRYVEYPLLVRVPADGFDATMPVTSGLQAALFPWAQPVLPGELPEGVVRTELIQTSPDSYHVDLATSIVPDPDQIGGQSEVLYAQGQGQSYSIAAVLEGRFPSPFDRGAPEPFDPFGKPGPSESTDEEVLSAAAHSQVVVFGDCDWIRDNGPIFRFFARENELLLSNLADWLTLNDELVALRSRLPRDRALRDFYSEWKVTLGVHERGQTETGREDELVMLRDREARRRASADRWKRMLFPMLLTLLLVLGFGALWNLRERARRAA